MEYLILLTVFAPIVLGIALYFAKMQNRNLKNIIIGSVIGLVVILNIVLAFFNGKFNLFNLNGVIL